ncbi:MAG: alpha/beta hydrolase [Archangiaceae bacterium]|nr:alpha/beta hydrolase [Archangiaceae bacterium]
MKHLALLLLALAGCVREVPLPDFAERHRPMTDDGLELSMVRYRARGEPAGRPVLLCHGISANDRNMDLDEHHSLARWLSEHGREAWTMSLRGTGTSTHPVDATFDDFWQHDLPAAIHEVQRVSGAEQIDYVGHSMGGMIVYAYLAEGGQGLGAVATLGSPTNLATGTLSGPAVVFLPGNFSIPSGSGAYLAAPFEGAIDDGLVARLFYNPENTRPEVFARLMAYGTADIAGGVARQLSRLGAGHFESADGKLDFRRDMARVTTPVLVVAGRLDRVAPAPAVKDGYRALGGPKEWLMVSQAHGAKAEYGHMDLVVGERAAEEVWSKVLTFFHGHTQEVK